MPHTMRDTAQRKRRRRRRRKKKGRTWAEAARTVLEKYHNTPMSHKEILQVIQREGLKEISGTSPLACLNAMLHTNSRGEEGMFYKVPGRMGVYTLKKDVADVVKGLSDYSEDSSDPQSDTQSSERSSSSSSTSAASNRDRTRSCWKRKVTSRLSQPSSPQSSCPSPPIPVGKVISPSQKLSKKALKQALKQQQQKKQRRAGMAVTSSQHLLLKTVKTTSGITPAKPTTAHTWAAKRTEAQSRTSQISAPTSALAVKSNESLHGLGKKALQRSDRLQARHLKRTKCAEIDVETPESILVNTNLRALINKHTFSLLPLDCQQRLLRLLPEVDQPAGTDGLLRLNSSALNNEFFTSASQSWKERLAEGEFTPEMQLRIRQEIEKEKRVESWKEQFYESYYGENSGLSVKDFSELTTEDDDNQDKISSPKVHTTLEPGEVDSRTLVSTPDEDHLSGKTEADLDSFVKPELSEATEAIPQPGKPDTDIIDMAVSLHSTEVAAEPKPDGSVEEKIEAIEAPSSCESKNVEQKSPICLTPSKPKSPTLVQPHRVSTNKDDLQQDSSEGESPGKVEVTISSGAKRRLDISEDFLAGPEKSPRLTEVSQSQQSFRALCRPLAETAQQALEQKLSPPQIPMSWISPKPFLSSQVSHRPMFPTTGTSPGRTGARTLADIKAKAQMARAQRAAAVAAHGGSIPGPGPGGGAGPGGGTRVQADETRNRVLSLGGTGRGRGERGTSPPPSDSQNQAETKSTVQAPAHSPARAQLLQKPYVQPGLIVRATRLYSGPTRNLFQTSERDVSLDNIKLNLPAVTPDTPIRPSGPSETMASFQSSLRFERELFPKCTDISSTQSTKRAQVDDSQPHISAIPGYSTQSMALGLQQAEASLFKSNATNATHRFNKLPLSQAPDPSVKPPQLGTAGQQITRSSSSIPANNPLVTQLLQGKNVPFEQILPRPLTKVEMKAVPFSSTDRPPNVSTVPVPQGLESCGREEVERPSQMAAQQLERFLTHNRQLPSSQRIWQLFSGKDLTSASSHQMQVPEACSTNQEHVLQALIKKVWQENSMAPPNPPEFKTAECTSQTENISQRFMLGFVWRRTSKPAMSGHYLLNISTYGRVPEAFRRAQAGSTDANICLNDPDHFDNVDDDTESVTESGEEDTESEESTEECGSPTVKADISLSPKSQSLPNNQIPDKIAQSNLPQTFNVKETVQIVTKGKIYNESNIARDLIHAAQAKMANVLGVRLKHNASDMFGRHSSSTVPQLHHPDLLQTPRTCGNPGLIGPSYGGTINISTSPDGLHPSSIPTGGNFSSSNADNVVSFSVTVTTIPSSQNVSSGGHEQPISVQTYTEDSGIEMAPSKCYCRLKAMIMCKGCGAFCHDDCIGPSKLCVSCLVVR
ncbi:putative Polycomb group protein ASXL2 isoform X2 [Mixophyes fleayi]|uniref:putative Polycomb group protein ASXL2 isoform X2 n=1 Tax=Mixophyes fleayi TaxID=3061075 RepID=UPI003F4DAEC2